MGNSHLWQCATCKVGLGDLALRWEKTGRMLAENNDRINKLESKVEEQQVKEDYLEMELKKTKDQ